MSLRLRDERRRTRDDEAEEERDAVSFFYSLPALKIWNLLESAVYDRILK